MDSLIIPLSSSSSYGGEMRNWDYFARECSTLAIATILFCWNFCNRHRLMPQAAVKASKRRTSTLLSCQLAKSFLLIPVCIRNHIILSPPWWWWWWWWHYYFQLLLLLLYAWIIYCGKENFLIWLMLWNCSHTGVQVTTAHQPNGLTSCTSQIRWN